MASGSNDEQQAVERLEKIQQAAESLNQQLARIRQLCDRLDAVLKSLEARWARCLSFF